MKTPITIALTALMLSACTSTEPSRVYKPTHKLDQQQLTTAVQCCSSLNTMAYQALPDSGKITLNITNSSPIVQLNTGYSFVEGIELPNTASSIRVRVHSQVEHTSVFIPSILVLNAQFEALDIIDGEAIEYHSTDLFDTAGYAGDITLPARYVSGERAKFLVVFTTEKDASGSTEPEKPSDMAIRTGDIEANIAHNTNHQIPHAYTGSVRLHVNLERMDSAKSQVERQQKLNQVVSSNDGAKAVAVHTVYHDSVKYAVQSGDFAKALAYVEEAEAQGIQGVREVFIAEMKNYQE